MIIIFIQIQKKDEVENQENIDIMLMLTLMMITRC